MILQYVEMDQIGPTVGQNKRRVTWTGTCWALVKWCWHCIVKTCQEENHITWGMHVLPECPPRMVCSSIVFGNQTALGNLTMLKHPPRRRWTTEGLPHGSVGKRDISKRVDMCWSFIFPQKNGYEWGLCIPSNPSMIIIFPSKSL
jgi:hypothetical protein